MIRQREVWWAGLPEPSGSEAGFRRPVVVVQGDRFNRSRIATAVCVPLTSQLRLLSAGQRSAQGELHGFASRLGRQRLPGLAVDRQQLHERAGLITERELQQLFSASTWCWEGLADRLRYARRSIRGTVDAIERQHPLRRPRRRARHRRLRAVDGHGDERLRSRGDQDRAAGRRRHLPALPRAARNARLRDRVLLDPRRPQQEERRPRSQDRSWKGSRLPPDRDRRRVHHQLPPVGAREAGDDAGRSCARRTRGWSSPTAPASAPRAPRWRSPATTWSATGRARASKAPCSRCRESSDRSPAARAIIPPA